MSEELSVAQKGREMKEGRYTKSRFFFGANELKRGFMSPLLLFLLSPPTRPMDALIIIGRGRPCLYQAVKCHLVRLVQTALREGLPLPLLHGKSETSHVRN